MKVLICGGRKYTEYQYFWDTMDKLHKEHKFTLVIDGACRTGADRLAGAWALKQQINSHRYPAKWIKLGMDAGPVRNTEMLDKESPDLVVAFPGGPGTNNMVVKAVERGIKVIEIKGKSNGKKS